MEDTTSYLKSLQIKHEKLLLFQTFSIVDKILSLSFYCKSLIRTPDYNTCNIFPHSLQDAGRLWPQRENDKWSVGGSASLSTSCTSLLSLIRLKIALRAHLTRLRLVRISSNVDPSCPHYKGQPVDYALVLSNISMPPRRCFKRERMQVLESCVSKDCHLNNPILVHKTQDRSLIRFFSPPPSGCNV